MNVWTRGRMGRPASELTHEWTDEPADGWSDQ